MWVLLDKIVLDSQCEKAFSIFDSLGGAFHKLRKLVPMFRRHSSSPLPSGSAINRIEAMDVENSYRCAPAASNDSFYCGEVSRSFIPPASHMMDACVKAPMNINSQIGYAQVVACEILPAIASYIEAAAHNGMSEISLSIRARTSKPYIDVACSSMSYSSSLFDIDDTYVRDEDTAVAFLSDMCRYVSQALEERGYHVRVGFSTRKHGWHTEISYPVSVSWRGNESDTSCSKPQTDGHGIRSHVTYI